LPNTSSLNSVKLASERAREPLGVWTDSRISKRPLGRATTYAIPTRIPTRRDPHFGDQTEPTAAVDVPQTLDPCKSGLLLVRCN
jgi:hypothetical protein